MVNFYQDVWPKRSHILVPLNKLSSKTGKLNWLWTTIYQQAFDEAKALLCKNDMLVYPDFTKLFDLYTNASNLQLGATLVQERKPLVSIQENSTWHNKVILLAKKNTRHC